MLGTTTIDLELPSSSLQPPDAGRLRTPAHVCFLVAFGRKRPENNVDAESGGELRIFWQVTHLPRKHIDIVSQPLRHHPCDLRKHPDPASTQGLLSGKRTSRLSRLGLLRRSRRNGAAGTTWGPQEIS